MKFSFVIPTYNNYGLLHQVLWDIYQKCSPVHEVIVVDDCSTDLEVQTGLNWWKGQDLLPLRHVRLNKNVMFLRASNVGLKLAEGDIVCLLSNDVRLHKDIVGHMTNMFVAHDDHLLIGGRYLNFDTGWNTFGSAMFPYLEGWLLTATKNSWKSLDYFDEQFVPSDMEDVDLSAKARMMEYHLISLPEDMTTHLGGQSIGFNPAREAITTANKEKFRKKWVEIDED